jgi:hypothetical protein
MAGSLAVREWSVEVLVCQQLESIGDAMEVSTILGGREKRVNPDCPGRRGGTAGSALALISPRVYNRMIV